MTVTALGLPQRRHSQGRRAAANAEPVYAEDPGLIDRFGRVVRDLRVSVTDRCNLRCTYCMPADGLDWLDNDAVLTTGEFVRIIAVAVRDLGVRSVRFTGGEPLLRRDLEAIVAGVAALYPRPEIALTTNGVGLRHRIDGLVAAGLDRINVSLDTVDPERFARITRRARLTDVVDGLAAARRAGLGTIKVNAVVPDRQDLARLPELARFCLDHGYQLRVIEQMPLDADHRWNRTQMVTADDILDALRSEFTLVDDDRPRGSAPADTWMVPGHHTPGGEPARIGVIASITRPFCGDCDRTRLTADGMIRNGLFADSETDLRPILRSGARTSEETDAAITAAWRANTWAKAAGHGVNDPGFHQPDRPMSAIGG